MHRTRYDYGCRVFLEPHQVRLVPRGDASQRLLRFHAAITPEPAGRTLVTDALGNTVLMVWFVDTTDHFAVTTEAVVETLRGNPFDYLVETPRAVLPIPLTRAEAAVAASCLEPVAGEQRRTLALAERLRQDGADTPQDFALALLSWISANLRTGVRLEPGILDPDAVLAAGEASCRDLTVFFMAACRHVGIPARFASGYHEGDPDSDEQDLHAWAEVCLPGGGWRGFDPSLGLAVADRHIVLAASPHPDDAAPVFGAFRGDGGTARLTHEIRLQLSQPNE
ncbi:Protein containing transglutaminase-like domain, putative cysteine protease [Desulfovibrio sp. TomC]|nr:Protein containing transglutaminase-like domain, putative cysteine protease [Desulfovibrio sp. TomC]